MLVGRPSPRERTFQAGGSSPSGSGGAVRRGALPAALRAAGPLAIGALLAWAGAAPGQAACTGDCNADGAIGIHEVVRGVNIALALRPRDDCVLADRDDDGRVTIDEVVAAVTFGLAGCPGLGALDLPTPTPTPTPSCPNLAGRWVSRERGTITCVSSRLEAEETGEIEGEEKIKIKQSECQVSYTVPDVNLDRTGVVDGASVSFSGPFLRANSQQTLGKNFATLVGTVFEDRIELAASGEAIGTFDDGRAQFSCTGTSIVVLTPDD